VQQAVIDDDFEAERRAHRRRRRFRIKKRLNDVVTSQTSTNSPELIFVSVFRHGITAMLLTSPPSLSHYYCVAATELYFASTCPLDMSDLASATAAWSTSELLWSSKNNCIKDNLVINQPCGILRKTTIIN
jgi:hypothetical protein